VSIIEAGIRPGEKIHEILMSDFESQTTVVYDEQYLVILPTLDMPELKARYSKYPHVSFNSFSSENNLMDQREIKDILIRGGFLQ
jgi:FlaA1/EpsC-like NDP-sugar epimerase